MSGNFHTFKLADGYALSLADGYGFTSNWVDVHSTPFVSVHVVFTGGSPSGTLVLQESNDRQSTKSTGVFPESAGSSTGNAIDTVNVPSIAGLGQVTASVTGAGVYTLNQTLFTSRWFRVVFTDSVAANTTLDILVHLKRN